MGGCRDIPSRRQFLTTTLRAAGGLLALAGAGYAGYRWPHPRLDPAPPTAQPGVWHFASRPDLSPPAVTVTRYPAHAAGPVGAAGSAGAPHHIFLSPKGYVGNGPGQQGLMILDTAGQLVWFLPMPANAPFNFQMQTYQGKPVLTWWSGSVTAGHGQGACTIMDASYRTIATIQAGNGLQADLHEMTLTPAGTALITAYRTAAADLSALGGPTSGQVLSCQAQEIDIATGQMIFAWDSLDHVPVTETRAALASGDQTTPFDYFHMNSISLAPDGDLLISSRNTWTVYKVSRASGNIVWRLNGKASDFAMGPGAAFYWQHHVRAHAGNQLSIFDDGSSPPEESQSRGILLSVDETAKQARLVRQYVHPARLLADNQGSMQILPDGRVFVGWGDQPYFSEFTADGTLVLDGRLPANDQSYRAFAYDWVGKPTDAPALAVQPSTTRGVTAYASWNGATELASWRVLAGASASSLSPAATVHRAGFETAIAVGSSGPYFVAAALDRSGREIGRSAPVHLT